jgi:hypothetical protein
MNDLPSGSVNVVVEHHIAPNLLFLGTEHSLYASTDGGRHWAKFESSLPTTLYDDLVIHPRDNDLIVGTHGRSIWILDDLTPLVEWSRAARADGAFLFSTSPATIFQYWKDTSYRGQAAFAGENPPFGALLTYNLPETARSASIQIMNSAGELVRELNVPTEEGVHRVAWDLRHAPIEESPVSPMSVSLPQPVGDRGPFVSPGTYSVQLAVDGRTSSQQLLVRGDPEMPLSMDQWRERESFLVDLQTERRDIADAIAIVTELRRGATRGDEADNLQLLGQQLRSLMSAANRLASEFNGSGVRQGTLYGPTETQRDRKQRLDRSLAAVIAEVDRLRGR